MIIQTFAAYRSCKQELVDVEVEREKYFQSLPGTTVPGISYSDERGSGSNKSNMSYISDKLDAWDKHKQPVINYCKQVIELCDKWLLLMDDDVRRIFILMYVEGKTQKETADIIGYERSHVPRTIRKESIRIKETHMCIE